MSKKGRKTCIRGNNQTKHKEHKNNKQMSKKNKENSTRTNLTASDILMILSRRFYHIKQSMKIP
jgi:hypothetical protein